MLVSTRDPDDGGVPLVPDHRRRGDRGGGPDRPVRPGMSPSPGDRLDGTREPPPPHPPARPTPGATFMAIEVRIPTILRTYTGGAKSVEGYGRHARRADRRPGRPARRAARPADRQAAALRRFVNVYLNDEDVRFLGGLETPVKDGDTVTVLPAVAGGALGGRPDRARRRAERGEPCGTTHCSTRSAARRWSGCPGSRPSHGRAAVGQAGGPQPDRLGQGPGRVFMIEQAEKDGLLAPGLHDPGAHLGQHRHLAGHGRPAAAATG